MSESIARTGARQMPLLRQLLLICIWTACTAALAGCASMPVSTEPPYLSIISVEPMEVTPLEQKYRLKVRIQNPNDHDIDISGMSYVLEVNGHSLVKGVSDDAVQVPRFGESVIEMSGVSTLFGFVRQIQALQDRQSPGMDYRLSGKLSLKNGFGSLPFSYEGTLLPPKNSGDEI
jgi:LEA14-like dessication related protein